MKRTRKILVLFALSAVLLTACGKSKSTTTTTAKSSTTVTVVKAIHSDSLSESQNHLTQAYLKTAYTNAKTIFVDSQDYTQVNAAALTAVDDSLTYVNGDQVSTGPKVVSVDNYDSTHIVLAAKSDSGTCFYIKDDTDTGITYATSTSSPCEADLSNSATFTSSW
jgi:hypothetical protein